MSDGWVKALSGSLGGLSEALLCQPLDVVKTRLQLDRQKGAYKGAWHCAQTIYRVEGGRALYKGLFPFSFHLVCKYGLRYGTYNFFQTRLNSPMLAGAVAGATEAVLVVTPCEVIKTRLQQRGAIYTGTIDCLWSTLKKDGFAALWRGVGPTIVRQTSNQAANFYTVHHINRNWFGKKNEKHVLPVWQTAVAGLLGGAVGPTLNHPFDVAKSRLMAKDSSYRNTWHVLSDVSKTEGLRGLYRGFLPRIARVAPGQMITWVTVFQTQAAIQHLSNTTH
jgi:solute carrier family 25 citrate transporter 1